jgi:Luciferase
MDTRWREIYPDIASHADESFADRALEQLRQWPALEVCHADCGVGMGVATETAQIVHLHQPDEARLRLTRPVIQRLSDAFSRSSQVHVEPDSDWVRVRLDSEGDIGLLVSLVSLAIQAHTQRPAEQQ